MWICLRRIFAIELVYIMQIAFIVEGLYIYPSYEPFGRNKRGLCVQMQTNEADSPEPYYMCKGAEFPLTQLNAPATFSYPSGENLVNWNHQQVPSAADVLKFNGEYRNNFYQQPTLQIGNENQRNAQYPQMLQMNMERFHDNSQPSIPHDMQQYFYRNTNLPHHQNYPSHLELSSINPTASQNTNENRPKTDLDSSKTDILPLNETNSNYENKMERVANIDQANDTNINAKQQIPTKSEQDNINAQQFHALIEDEVLGTPNLSFSNDEILPIEKMFSEHTPEIPQIPSDYLDDPILRTFYSLDHNHDGNIEQQYFTPKMEHYNSFSSEQSILEAQAKLFSNMSPTESLFANKCTNFIYKPIFIAIPCLMRPPYCNQLPNLQSEPNAYGQQISQGTATYHQIESNVNKGSTYDHLYRSQLRAANDNLSIKDLSNNESEMKSSEQQTSSTKIPASSEEDLFADDSVSTADKVSKNDDDKSNVEAAPDKVDKVTIGTTSAPHTTVRTFKAIIHAAKMHAMGLRGNTNPIQQQVHNKRNIPNMDSGADTTNTKKQYVTQLKKDYN